MLTELSRRRGLYHALLTRGDPYRPAAMQVPTPTSRRGRMLAMQLRNEEPGYFRERVLDFGTFPALTHGGSATATLLRQVPSLGGRFVRLVAMRGIILNTNTPPLTGLEPASVLLRLVLNGSDDLVASQIGGTNSASFDMLFSHTSGQYVVPSQLDATLSSDPWFWFAAPPRLRTGDRLQATVTNIGTFEGEGLSLTPELALRLVDAAWWERFYLEGAA